MKSKFILLLMCIFMLSMSAGCKDIAGNIKARFGKLTQGISSSAPSGKFGNTAEEQAMINAVTEKYGDLRQSGSPRILELMVASGVVNHIPSDRVSQYSSRASKLYAWFIYDNFSEENISVEWIYLDDKYSIGTSKAKAGKDFGRGAFILEAPDDGWPTGAYRVKVSGKGVTESIDFRVVDAETVSVAILLPGGSVDLAGSGKASGGSAGKSGVTGSITTGKSTALASKSIGASGGMIVVSKPGDPLDGLQIAVPPDSYKNTRNFKVSSAPIDSHTFGKHFNPLTPMIIVENSGEYADELMTVTIPVRVPDDHFAMAFFYDEKSGRLDGMTVVGIENNAIRVATRHFSRFTVSGIMNSVLEGLIGEGIESGYAPGTDDWQFVNYGSYISPGGNCSAQSNTSIWYYCRKPDGDGARLYGRYDNNFSEQKTPGLQFDDSLAYRFVSVIQENQNDEFTRFARKLWHETQGTTWSMDKNGTGKMVPAAGISDASKRKLFAYSMQMTGEPQALGIWTEDGIGHALVVYRITSDKLHVADPNYPGSPDMAIRYSNGSFEPYQTEEKETGLNKLGVSKLDKLGMSKLDKLGVSKLDKDEVSKTSGGRYWKYTFFYTSRSMIPWDIMAHHWGQLKAGKAGDGLFPKYKLMYYTGEDVWDWDASEVKPHPLADSTVLKDTSIYPVAVFEDGDPEGEAVYLWHDGKWLPTSLGIYEFKPGKYTVGVFVQREGQAGSAKLKQDTASNMRYVDFKYITVICPATVTIQPPRIMIYELKEGAAEVSHDFTAVAEPDGEYIFEWDFGDGKTFTDKAKGPGEKSTLSHTYEELKAGDKFYPRVKLYSMKKELLAEDTISISIEGEGQAPATAACLKAGEKYNCNMNMIELTLLSVKKVPEKYWVHEPLADGYAVLRYKIKNTGKENLSLSEGDYIYWNNNGVADVRTYPTEVKYPVIQPGLLGPGQEETREMLYYMRDGLSEVEFMYVPVKDRTACWKLPVGMLTD